jgi:hypothetical protein
MSIRNMLFAAALTLASLGGAAQANGFKPIEARSINLGEVSGVVYYTVEPDGLRVVTTLAQGEAGTPIRFCVGAGARSAGSSLDAASSRCVGNQSERRQRDHPQGKRTLQLNAAAAGAFASARVPAGGSWPLR